MHKRDLFIIFNLIKLTKENVTFVFCVVLKYSGCFFFSIKRKGLAGSALVDICSLSLAKTSHVCGALSLNINRGTYKVNPVSVCYSYAINRFPDASSSLSDNKKVYRTYQVGDMLQRVREHIFFFISELVLKAGGR